MKHMYEKPRAGFVGYVATGPEHAEEIAMTDRVIALYTLTTLVLFVVGIVGLGVSDAADGWVVFTFVALGLFAGPALVYGLLLLVYMAVTGHEPGEED